MNEQTCQPPGNRPAIRWTLRCLGFIDLCALVAVVMPHEWMQFGHLAAGLGDLPEAPVVGYLARSTSALYAMHGMLVLYMSFDVTRYWPLIRFFAAAAVVHGFIMLGIDLSERMPFWWTIVEGPGFAATGLAVLVVQAMTASAARA